jgi:hypothetical protein
MHGPMNVKIVDNNIQVNNIDTKGRYFCLSMARMVTRTDHSVTLFTLHIVLSNTVDY